MKRLAQIKEIDNFNEFFIYFQKTRFLFENKKNKKRKKILNLNLVCGIIMENSNIKALLIIY